MIVEQPNQPASQTIQSKRFYSVCEAAEICETGREPIRRLFLKGLLEGRRIGGLIKLDRDSVNSYAGITSHTQTEAANG